jgi:hypothetical protein
MVIDALPAALEVDKNVVEEAIAAGIGAVLLVNQGNRGCCTSRQNPPTASGK